MKRLSVLVWLSMEEEEAEKFKSFKAKKKKKCPRFKRVIGQIIGRIAVEALVELL